MTAAESTSKRQPRQKKPSTSEAIAAHFVACSRCSYFLAGYRLLEKDFEAAAEHSSGDWLLLSWSKPVRSLVHSSYGYRVDLDAYHFEGVCPDCRRVFIFDAPDGDPEKATFEIQVGSD